MFSGVRPEPIELVFPNSPRPWEPWVRRMEDGGTIESEGIDESTKARFDEDSLGVDSVFCSSQSSLLYLYSFDMP